MKNNGISKILFLVLFAGLNLHCLAQNKHNIKQKIADHFFPFRGMINFGMKLKSEQRFTVHCKCRNGDALSCACDHETLRKSFY